MSTELKVEGMSCNNCKAHVEKALKAVAGVEKVEVFLQEGRASVQGSAPLDKLIEAVQQEGYQASLDHQ
jgi:copper chaperone